jgi:prepilin-type N-terminal cleavage/methylation domain-containing protein
MGEGFTLIELMIVVAIIAIIAAIAIPSLLESKKAANEASAISSLRTIGSAEELYFARTGKYGLKDSLNDGPGGPRRMIDKALRDAYTGSSTPRSGYYFDITVSGSNSAWSAVAHPSEWGITGERNFIIGGGGVIYWNEDSTENGTGNTTFTLVLGSS